MARLKRRINRQVEQASRPWLADRIRDGAIETKPSRGSPYFMTIGLPIGFAMARLKLIAGAVEPSIGQWLADRIRDGAIETQG